MQNVFKHVSSAAVSHVRSHSLAFVFVALVFASVIAFDSSPAHAQNSFPSFAPPLLTGNDALGRAMPLPGEVRPFQNDKYVGIFYFTWLKNIGVHDNSVILKKYPDAIRTNASPPWGPKNAFHFWGEPLFGYYRSDDPWILRRHAALLSDAGVDFIVLDATNSAIYADVVSVMIEVFAEQRATGQHVPRITFMVNSNAKRTAQRIHDTFYKPNPDPDLWFQFKGKPLLICDPNEASEEVAEYFTLRKAHWPFELVNTHNAWHWEATHPQVYSYDNDPKKPEQVSVSVGQNLHQDTGQVEMMSTGKSRGRSYHDGKQDTSKDAYLKGLNFNEQWQHALTLDPEVTFVTGWNEWIAMQLNLGEEGPPVFCDQFDLEASRDVEMMKGGYGDNYYLQMAANIRRFKGMNAASVSPNPPAKTIAIDGPMKQWDDIPTTYRDHLHDTRHRNFPGCGKRHYQITSGRNDFHLAKVTEDHEHVYFYMQTRDSISHPQDPNWMWLMLDIGAPDEENPTANASAAKHWEGFELRFNGGSVEVCRGGWQWESIGDAAYRVDGNQMHVAIPKRLLQPFLAKQTATRQIGFKWIDNSQSPGDIMDTYLNGDAAPGGRFRYLHRLR